MKMSDRRLKRIMQENPMTVQPKKKEKMLEFARMCDEKSQDLEDGLNMKFIRTKKLRMLLVAAIILSLLAVTISAGIVHYYYHTPGGNIVDENGNIVETTLLEKSHDLILKTTDEEIKKDGYTISSVDWTRIHGKTTLSVWTTADSVELNGLTAVINEKEYPLEKTLLTSDGFVGYTANDVPEPDNPEGLFLKCTAPKFSYLRIFFMPDDVLLAESTSNGISIIGYQQDGDIYIGLNEDHLVHGNLIDAAGFTAVIPQDMVAVDTKGNRYTVSKDNLLGRGGLMDLCFYYQEAPEDVVFSSLDITRLMIVYGFISGKEPSCSVPVPEIGETLTGEWTVFDCDGFKYIINEISRDAESLTIISYDDMQYNGTQSLSKDHYILSPSISPSGLQLSSRSSSRSGDSAKVTITYHADTLPEFLDENDTISMCMKNFTVYYEGNWELTFPEN